MISNEDAVKEIRQAYRLGISLILLLLVLFSLAWRWFSFNPVPLAQPQMVIDAIEIPQNDFCPGDVLTYTYTVTVSRAGVYIFDASIWAVDPPGIVLFNDSLRMAAAKADTIHVVRNWLIPSSTYNTLTDSVDAWQPGDYERYIAITSSGRDTLPSIAVIPFTIRADCR